MNRLGSRISDQEDKRVQIDSSLTIVNIVLLLIFFFLATGSMLASRGVEVALPDTTELPLDMLPTPLLTIADDGSLNLNGEPIETGTLADATLDDPILHILVDRDQSALHMLSVLAAEELVAQEIRLVTVHRKEGDGS